MRGPPGPGNDDAEAVLFGRGGESERLARGAVGGKYLYFERNFELFEDFGGCRQYSQVRIASHDDGCFEHTHLLTGNLEHYDTDILRF
jgi:hypothetical protein